MLVCGARVTSDIVAVTIGWALVESLAASAENELFVIEFGWLELVVDGRGRSRCWFPELLCDVGKSRLDALEKFNRGAFPILLDALRLAALVLVGWWRDLVL